MSVRKHIVLIAVLMMSVGCASLQIDGNGNVVAAKTTGDSHIEIETCDTIKETLDAEGAVTGTVKTGCQIVKSAGGKASEGLLATVLQGLSVVVGLISLGRGF